MNNKNNIINNKICYTNKYTFFKHNYKNNYCFYVHIYRIGPNIINFFEVNTD